MDRATAEAVVAELVKRGAIKAQRIQAEADRTAGIKSTKWNPHKPTEMQERFLALDCREALYGGAAGGGKSDALLMGALEYVDDPEFSALLLRRTYKDLALPGALLDRAEEWLEDTPADWVEKDKTWVFPSGATITFGYLATENDKRRYKSAEFNYIAFDELTEFTETQYTYLLTRLRRKAGSTIPSKMRSASNPDGPGHEWVKRRFVEKEADTPHEFVPATLDDNPHVDIDDYEQSMEGLDDITYQQLRKGVWISNRQGLVYRYDPARNLVTELPPEDWILILGLDLGSSETKPTTAFVINAFSKAEQRTYTTHSEKLAGMTPSDIAEHIRELEEEHGAFEQIVMDEGALGKGYGNEFRQRWSIPVQPAEKSNKLGYRKLLNGALERGELVVLDGFNDDLINEVNALRWDDKGTDNEKGKANHCSDAWLYSWRATRAWLVKPGGRLPPRGTPERADAEALDRKRRVAQRMAQRKKEPYWKRRRGAR